MLGRVGARALSTSAATAVRRSQHSLLGASAVAAGVAAGVYGYQSECLKIDMPAQSKAARYNTLMKSPTGAQIKCCVVEFNVPGAKNGGTDKGPNGHRIDSIPIANGVIKAGGACDIVKYFDTKHEVRAHKHACANASAALGRPD